MPQTVRSVTNSLAASMRTLSLAARPAALPAVQTRCLSQAVLATPKTALSAGVAAPAVQSGVAVFQKVQTRGMKVRSAIKKRCEHCKVTHTTEDDWGCFAGGNSQRLSLQVVRRKANKRHNGYLYVICPANPRHKQRQG